MGIATIKLLELAVFYEETKPILDAYADFSGSKEQRDARRIDELEKACVRLIYVIEAQKPRGRH